MIGETARASPKRLRAHVEALEGERHSASSPGAKRRAMNYVRSQLASLGLSPVLDPFSFQGEIHHNIVATIPGSDPSAPRILVGAHIDTVRGSPGADDNASGVAGLLECARILASTRSGGDGSDRERSGEGSGEGSSDEESLVEEGTDSGRGRSPFRSTVELVVFDLEEQQLFTYRVGSRRHTARARREGVEYAGGLIFEMIGYTSKEAGSQRIPLLVRWKDIPRTGDFLAAVGDWKSGDLLRSFEDAARHAAPELDVYSHRTPFRGWLVWQTRLSDNASFWSEGYPALMLTDTAFLRNPHYHGAGDTAVTLDYEFMGRVVDSTVECVRRMAVPPSGSS